MDKGEHWRTKKSIIGKVHFVWDSYKSGFDILLWTEWKDEGSRFYWDGIYNYKGYFKKFGYNPDDGIIKKVFKVNIKRGERSAMDLRNGIVHNLNSNDLMVVMDRKAELFKLLDDYYEFLIQPIEW